MTGRTLATLAAMLVLAVVPGRPITGVDAAILLAAAAVMCVCASRVLARPVLTGIPAAFTAGRRDARTSIWIRLCDPDAPGRPRPRAPAEHVPTRA